MKRVLALVLLSACSAPCYSAYRCVDMDTDKAADWVPQCIGGRAPSDEEDHRVPYCEAAARRLFCRRWEWRNSGSFAQAHHLPPSALRKGACRND
jgi:hypothetical protein